MKHLEANDVLSVLLDDYRKVNDFGLILTKEEAILEHQRFRTATVYAAPEHYTISRTREEKRMQIRVKSPVKAGDRVLLDKYAGITMATEHGKRIALIRFHEVVAILDSDAQVADAVEPAPLNDLDLDLSIA